MEVNFQSVESLEESELLPYNWNAVVYWSEDRQRYVFELIKKKGLDLGVSHMPKGYVFKEFTDYEMGAVDAVIYPKKEYAKVFSAGRFATFIDQYSPLKELAKTIRMYV